MPRNAEVIRQWTILREIERAHAPGATIDRLARVAAPVELAREIARQIDQAGQQYDTR